VKEFYRKGEEGAEGRKMTQKMVLGTFVLTPGGLFLPRYQNKGIIHKSR
jgi:hypothetical protein